MAFFYFTNLTDEPIFKRDPKSSMSQASIDHFFKYDEKTLDKNNDADMAKYYAAPWKLLVGEKVVITTKDYSSLSYTKVSSINI